VADLPLAVTPWQLLQPEVIPTWLNVAELNEVTVWQTLHSEVVATWFAGLPTAALPVWQEEQVPCTWVWSTLNGVHVLPAEWQA